jgi:hypothetical protein
MNINKKVAQLSHLIKLIEKEKTGNANDLAQRVGLSRGKLYDLFEEFKAIDVEIKFDRVKNSFCYANHKRIKVNAPIQVIDSAECEKISGGLNQKNSFFHFSGLHPTYI